MSSHSRFIPNDTPCGKTRREFLWQAGGGFAGLGLIDLLTKDNAFGGELAARPQHFAAKAKHVVFLFMNGGPSHVDTFDPKPILTKFNGKKYTGKQTVGSNGRPIGYLTQTAFQFQNHGQGGLPISSVYPHLSRHADELCVIRSMHSDTAAHASACIQMNTGSVLIGKPAMGSWLSYGLGTENENLPSFVVMTDPRGGPIGSASNWSSGFMPAAYQGTMFRSEGLPLLNLATPKGTTEKTQRRGLDLLKTLNGQYVKERAAKGPVDSELLARIESYELAYRMQTEAAEAVDLNREDKQTREMYGLDRKLTADFGRKCLITRRLIERGVRFIQIMHGSGAAGAWDQHSNLKAKHAQNAMQVDRPVAGLLKDLKERGLLDETLVVFATEFGRTPGSQGSNGRDHHPYGFSVWMAGGGLKGGVTHGTTDEIGFHTEEHPHYVTDVHATLLQQMGLNPRRLSLPNEPRLEIDYGHPIKEIIA